MLSRILGRTDGLYFPTSVNAHDHSWWFFLFLLMWLYSVLLYSGPDFLAPFLTPLGIYVQCGKGVGLTV
jgi:hypothetical protein